MKKWGEVRRVAQVRGGVVGKEGEVWKSEGWDRRKKRPKSKTSRT